MGHQVSTLSVPQPPRKTICIKFSSQKWNSNHCRLDCWWKKQNLNCFWQLHDPWHVNPKFLFAFMPKSNLSLNLRYIMQTTNLLCLWSLRAHQVWLDTCCWDPEVWNLWLKTQANVGRFCACRATLTFSSQTFASKRQSCSAWINPACVGPVLWCKDPKRPVLLDHGLH